MACAYPQYRIPWNEGMLNNGFARHRLADLYEKRVHNGGILIQKPEFEMIQAEYPSLAKVIQQIPCGKCIQCRLAYSRDWANRCMAELKTSPNAVFVTLTYDTQHLQFAPFVDIDTGECSTRPVLVPKDLQKFFKRMREYCRSELNHTGIRFFACGEYGDKGQRPHYHAIIFNVPSSEVWAKAHFFSPDGVQPALFTSSFFDKLWPHGMVVFADVCWNTCAYVAGYCLKKKKGKMRQAQIKAQETLFPGQPWQEEFVRMSRRPGIGREYYDKNISKIYKDDAMYVNVKGKTQAVKPCKYYDKLYDVEHHLDLKHIKSQRRKAGELSFASELAKTSLNAEEYLIQKLETQEDRQKKMQRSLE